MTARSGGRRAGCRPSGRSRSRAPIGAARQPGGPPSAARSVESWMRPRASRSASRSIAAVMLPRAVPLPTGVAVPCAVTDAGVSTGDALADDAAGCAGCSPSSPAAPARGRRCTPASPTGIADDAELAGLLLHAPAAQRQPVLLFAVRALPCCSTAATTPSSPGSTRTSRPTPADGDPAAGARRVLSPSTRDRARRAAGDAQHADQRDRPLRPAAAGVRRSLAAEVGAAGAPRRRHQRRAQPAARPLPLHATSPADVGRRPVAGRRSTCGDPRRRAGPGGDADDRQRRRARPLARSTSRDPAQARWLEACVWPDQADRFERLRAALDHRRRRAASTSARATPSTDTRRARRRRRVGHPVVTNTWVLNYLQQRRARRLRRRPRRARARAATCPGSSPRARAVPELPGHRPRLRPTDRRSSSCAGAAGAARRPPRRRATPTATGCTGAERWCLDSDAERHGVSTALADADPRADSSGASGGGVAVVDDRSPPVAAQVGAVVGAVDAERLAQLARAVGEVAVRPPRRGDASRRCRAAARPPAAARPGRRPSTPVTTLAQRCMP